MSEVNADGVLINPQEALLQQVQHRTNALMARRPDGMEEDEMVTGVQAANSQCAGTVGGVHLPAGQQARRSEKKGRDRG